MDNELVMRTLCDARMQNVEDKLDNIRDMLHSLQQEVKELRAISVSVTDHEKRLCELENWKKGFSFSKIVITTAALMSALTAVYVLLQKIFLE